MSIRARLAVGFALGVALGVAATRTMISISTRSERNYGAQEYLVAQARGSSGGL